MTLEPGSPRVPPEIRRRLEGVEAELVERRASHVGRPTLYVIRGRVARAVGGERGVPTGTPPRRPGRRLAWVAVLAMVAVAGVGAMAAGLGPFDGSGGFGNRSTGAPGAGQTPAPGQGGLRASDAVPTAPLPSLDTLADVQVLRVAGDPLDTALALLRSPCTMKRPLTMDPAVMKRLVVQALADPSADGWLDDAHSALVARDAIDAAQAFGASFLVEGPTATWLVVRAATELTAWKLESFPIPKDRAAWWTSTSIRAIDCP